MERHFTFYQGAFSTEILWHQMRGTHNYISTLVCSSYTNLSIISHTPVILQILETMCGTPEAKGNIHCGFPLALLTSGTRLGHRVRCSTGQTAERRTVRRQAMCLIMEYSSLFGFGFARNWSSS